jgi:hypothetical protein
MRMERGPGPTRKSVLGLSRMSARDANQKEAKLHFYMVD